MGVEDTTEIQLNDYNDARLHPVTRFPATPLDILRGGVP